GLAVCQDFGGGKVFEVFVVCDDVMAPGVECFMDGKEFLVMGVIVELQSGEGLGVEHDWAEFIIQAVDGKISNDIVGGVGLNDDRGTRNPMSQNRSRGEGIFQALESGAAFFGEVPQSVFLSEVGEWNNNVRIIIDEAAVEVGKTKEGLDVFDFVSRHSQATRREEVSEIFDRGGVEFTFF
ncbi:hypothetical protein PAXRUDRAFT_161063, partial [Paxillus rubicundulus Ve08.2h10]